MDVFHLQFLISGTCSKGQGRNNFVSRTLFMWSMVLFFSTDCDKPSQCVFVYLVLFSTDCVKACQCVFVYLVLFFTDCDKPSQCVFVYLVLFSIDCDKPSQSDQHYLRGKKSVNVNCSKEDPCLQNHDIGRH